MREILTWIPSPNRLRPQLAVVLVDEDGVADRGRKLRDATSDPDLLPHVVAVAVREFESWLLADSAAVAAVAGQPLPSRQAVEDMEPGAAKVALTRVLGAERSRLARREIAARSDLALLAQLRSFGTFLHDMAAALE